MNIVKQLRKKADMQQQELAALVGVSCPTVSNWETGKKDPSGERLRRVAEIFNVDELVVLGVAPPDGPAGHVPITPEARILSAGIDKMPEADRERALSMMRLMFAQYADYFEKGESQA